MQLELEDWVRREVKSDQVSIKAGEVHLPDNFDALLKSKILPEGRWG